ncbi:DNA transposition protein [Vibrio cholerae]|nr:DNA transposition protein [Vibrio cholerae]
MINACALIENLNNRSAIVPGMGLIHGESGFGKTTALQYLFNQDTTNGVYIRCCANDTPTSVLNRIAKECGLIPAGRAYQTLDDIIECIRRNEFSLFVDEADYVVGSKKIMESFRDIYDNTEQPVVLVGMEEIARRISHRKQLHNRISEWVVFQPADLEDVATFAEELMEIDPQITIHDEVLDHIRAKSRGVVRTILSALSKLERAVNGNPPPDGVVTMQDIQSLDLFMTISRS